jgi:hypothetical protein
MIVVVGIAYAEFSVTSQECFDPLGLNESIV